MGHPELLTLVRRRQRRLVGVVKGRSAAVQGDSSAPAAGGRWKRVEFGQLGVLELVAGSAAPIGLHTVVSTSAAAAVGSGAAQVGPPALLAQARGWLWGAHHPGALLLLGAEPQAPLAHTPRIAGGGRADSGGAVSGADCAWAQMDSAGGLGFGLVGAWVGLGGLRPAKQLRPAKEIKGHGQTLVAGPRKRGDWLRVEGVGLRHAQE
jgi:hypothetical protein